MKTNSWFYKACFLIVLAGLLGFNNTYAQDSIPKIKVSTDKVFIDGKLYYVHIVEQGQTLYSICRAYGVAESDVAAENISVMYGPLQIGQALKIPVYQRRSDKETKKRDKKSKDFIEHQVKPRETLSFLSRKYRMLVDTIVKYNPSTADGMIQINQIINIPKHAINSIDKTEKKETKEVITHQVEAGETLSALQRKYGVSIDKIVLANPELVDGLKAGMELKIPLTQEATPLALQDTTSRLIDSLETLQQTLDTLGREPVVFECEGQEWDRFKTYKIALLLPFQLNNPTPDSMMTMRTYSKYISPKKGNEIYFEFYEGFLLAMDSLKNLGMNIQLYPFDTEKSIRKTQFIISEMIHIQPDLIVGPVLNELIPEVSEFAKLNKIPIVSPIKTDSRALFSNPYFFQAVPGKNIEIEKLSKFIADIDKPYKNVIFINSGDSLYIHEINYLKDKLYNSLENDFNSGRATFKEIIIRKEELFKTNSILNIKPRLIQSLAADTPNLVVLPSDKETYVGNIMDILNQLTDYYIEVFGYAELQRFDDIEQEYFHNLNVQIYTPFYFNLRDKNTQLFLAKYQDRFHNIPLRYTKEGYNFTLLGYDIGFYFGNALRIFGNQFPGCLDYYNPDLLLSKYKFERKDAYSGFSNTTIHILEYKDDFVISGSIIE